MVQVFLKAVWNSGNSSNVFSPRINHSYSTYSRCNVASDYFEMVMNVDYESTGSTAGNLLQAT